MIYLDLAQSQFIFIQNSMVTFSLQHHEQHMLPNHCLKVQDNQEDIENLIPGQCWINILSHAKKYDSPDMLKAYESLIIHLAKVM